MNNEFLSPLTNDLLIRRLSSLDSATLADVMVAMGLENQVLSPNFKTLNPANKIIGTALCAQATESSQQQTVSPIELDELVQKGNVIIISTQGSQRGAFLGDNMLTSMVQNGASGFIVDGGIRDSKLLKETKTGVVYRYTSSINAYRFLGFSSFDKVITLEGVWGEVKVEPNDLVLADCDGAVIIPAQYAETIIEDSEVHQKNEDAIKNSLTWGNSRKEALQEFPRLKHVKKIQK
jgi:4-hydroxy-4-methyl-2-oxoglutarate aldolase